MLGVWYCWTEDFIAGARWLEVCADYDLGDDPSKYDANLKRKSVRTLHRSRSRSTQSADSSSRPSSGRMESLEDILNELDVRLALPVMKVGQTIDTLPCLMQDADVETLSPRAMYSPSLACFHLNHTMLRPPPGSVPDSHLADIPPAMPTPNRAGAEDDQRRMSGTLGLSLTSPLRHHRGTLSLGDTCNTVEVGRRRFCGTNERDSVTHRGFYRGRLGVVTSK